MALLTAAGTEDELEYSYQPEEDQEYVCHESSEQEEKEEEEEEEEYVCLPDHGSTEQEEEEMDEEQQVLCEGRLPCNQEHHHLLCSSPWFSLVCVLACLVYRSFCSEILQS